MRFAARAVLALSCALVGSGCTVRVWGTDFAPPGPHLLCWPADDAGETFHYALDGRLVDGPAPAASVVVAVPRNASATLLERCRDRWLAFGETHAEATRHLIRIPRPPDRVRTGADLHRWREELAGHAAGARLEAER